MTIASPLLQQEQAATDSPSPSWGLALTGVIGSGKTTISAVLSGLLGWRVVSSGDVARSIDQDTARTGQMADAEALDRALLPLLSPGPVILDGYPRTMAQMVMLPGGFSVVALTLPIDLAFQRANQAAAASGKLGWDPTIRYSQQESGIKQVMAHAELIVEVAGKTPGEVAFEIISSDYLGPPIRR